MALSSFTLIDMLKYFVSEFFFFLNSLMHHKYGLCGDMAIIVRRISYVTNFGGKKLQ